MSINHDLTYYGDYLEVEKSGCVTFLDLGNRLETFDKDAEILECECGVTISRIVPRECVEGKYLLTTVPACRLYIADAADVIRKLIANRHEVVVVSRVQEVTQPVLFAPQIAAQSGEGS